MLTARLACAKKTRAPAVASQDWLRPGRVRSRSALGADEAGWRVDVVAGGQVERADRGAVAGDVLIDPARHSVDEVDRTATFLQDRAQHDAGREVRRQHERHGVLLALTGVHGEASAGGRSTAGGGPRRR